MREYSKTTLRIYLAIVAAVFLLIGHSMPSAVLAGGAMFQKLFTTQPTNVCDPTTLTNCAPVSATNGLAVDIKAITATASGPQTAANSDSIVCSTDNHCDVDILTIAAGSNNIGSVGVATVPADPFGTNSDAAASNGSISAKLRFMAATGIPITSIAAGNNNIGDVDIASLPNVTIGAAIPAGNNNIGDVDVVTLPALPTGTNVIGFVAPFPGTLIKGRNASPITNTASTQIIAGVASNFFYITSCTVSNTDADTSTEVNLQDGSGGTIIYTIPAPFGPTNSLGGAVNPFPSPLKVDTAGNGLFAAPVTTGASITVSCVGFRSTVSY